MFMLYKYNYVGKKCFLKINEYVSNLDIEKNF